MFCHSMAVSISGFSAVVDVLANAGGLGVIGPPEFIKCGYFSGFKNAIPKLNPPVSYINGGFCMLTDQKIPVSIEFVWIFRAQVEPGFRILQYCSDLQIGQYRRYNSLLRRSHFS